MYKMTRNDLIRRLLRDERGQTLVEYALVVAFISVVAISSLLALGGQVTGVYTTIDRQLTAAENASGASRH